MHFRLYFSGGGIVIIQILRRYRRRQGEGAELRVIKVSELSKVVCRRKYEYKKGWK